MCKSFDDINYREKFKYYIFNLETIIGIKKVRNRPKKNELKEINIPIVKEE